MSKEVDYDNAPPDLLAELNACKNLYSVHLPYPRVDEVEFRLNTEIRDQMTKQVAEAACSIWTRIGDWQAGVHGENGHVFMRMDVFAFNRADLYTFAERIYQTGLAAGRGAALLPQHEGVQ